MRENRIGFQISRMGVTERVAGMESDTEGFELGQRRQGHVARIWNIPDVKMGEVTETKVVAVLPRMA